MNTALTIFHLLLLLMTSCNYEPGDRSAQLKFDSARGEINETDKFNDYWYSGKAELNSYDIKQSRYGETRDGEVVLIFVTEPFSLKKQVKVDNPEGAGKDMVSVMKLNKSQKFNTGIYDYSILSSTFTPVDFKKHPFTLKTTTSVQEWCGHTFTQLNFIDNKYLFKQFSYFEAESDEEKQLKGVQLEDGLLTRIRINQGYLPDGEIELIPSTIYSRFTHNTLEATKAKISNTKSKSSINYTINYLNIKRTITIEVEKEFPYKIISWTEDNGDGLLTTARIKATTIQPYWNQKSIKDEVKRKELLQLKY